MPDAKVPVGYIVYSRTPLSSKKAVPKYISRPVTSTNVAIKGVDEVAGSAPSLFNNKGSMDPMIVPHKTTPTTAVPIANPIRIKCSPNRLKM